MARYDIETYTERVRALLSDDPQPREHFVAHGVPVAAFRMLQRNGILRPKMTPWYNREGKRIGAIEGWQLAPSVSTVHLHKRERLDCATMDFAAMGIG